jgi:hypothetical protein
VAAAPGIFPSHPEASPSESDQTDTDSNNITHPTETRPAPTVANIPVIRSTDTEFDFPTSDFNNIDDQLNDLSHAEARNDLSRAGSKKARSEKVGSGSQSQRDKSEDVPSASVGARPKSQPSFRRERERAGSPKVNQLSRKTSLRQSPAPDRNTPSPSQKQSKNAQNKAEKMTTASATSTAATVLSRDPQQTRAAMSELQTKEAETASRPTFGLGPTGDSFDDELLFATGDSEATKAPSVGVQNNSGNGAKKNYLMNVLPAVQPALSTDLTSLAQRSPLRNGAEKSVPAQRDQRKSPYPAEHNPEGLSHGGDSAGSGRKGSKDSVGRPRLPSPSMAAVKDWVSHAGNGESGKRHSDRDYAGAQSGLPFSAYAYGGGDDAAHSQGPAKDAVTKQGARTSSYQAFLEGPEVPVSVMRGDPSGVRRGSSGPSSDPSTHTMTVDSRGLQVRQSSSLPPVLFSEYASAKQEESQESLSARSAASDSAVDPPAARAPSAQSKPLAPSPLVTAKTTSGSTAVVTEKLLAGAVFSPIHPQPVSTTGSRPASSGPVPQTCTSSIVHPTPVTAVPSDGVTAPMTTAYAPNAAERNLAR